MMDETTGPDDAAKTADRTPADDMRDSKTTGFENEIADCWNFMPTVYPNDNVSIPGRADFILSQGMVLGAQKVFDDLARSSRKLMSVCESPIEKIFLAALIAEAQIDKKICFPKPEEWQGNPEGFIENGIDGYLRSQIGLCGSSPTAVVLQVPVENHRVDFLLYGASVSSENCEEWFRVKLVIEVDGHDFHEKTKEQARRDKARDRKLMKLGYHVMRFTGSEIWNDPRKCVLEATDFINCLQAKHAVEALKRGWGEKP